MRAARSTIAVVAFAAACAAPPMLLTKALFAPRPQQGRVVEGRYQCDIEAVRTRLEAATPATRGLAVDVVFDDRDEAGLPAHLHAYARTDAKTRTLHATFALSVADSRRRWPEDFVPGSSRSDLDLRLQDARYFNDGSSAAEVTFGGTLPPGSVVQVVPRESLGSLAERPAFSRVALPPGLGAALRAVRRHPWPQLAGAPLGERARCDPVAWLGPQGQVLSHEDALLLLQPWHTFELQREPPKVARDDCALLLRLTHRDARVRYLRVPLPLLHEGDDLTLACTEEIRWSRRDVWRARLSADAGETASWPASTLALARTRIPYGFDELERPATWPRQVFQTVLAPVTWTLDFLGWTNPLIQKLIEMAVDKPPEIQPVQGKR